MTDTDSAVADLYNDVVGQPDLVRSLQSAAEAPVHAYLLVGPEGSGKRAAATAFAAELLSRGLDEPAAHRAVRLVAAGVHPSFNIIERDGPSLTVDQARDVVRRSALAPPEGDLQVFVLDEFHLVREAAPILLKSIEEPPDSTVFLVLAESVPAELDTIASRCVQLRTSAVPSALIEQRLVAEGAEPDLAAEAARSGGGSLRRARLLVGDPDLVQRREAWRGAPTRLDGTGAAVCAIADELLEGAESVLTPLQEKQELEIEAFDEMVERTGVARKGDRARLETRHRREARRLRTEALLGGLASLVGSYREEVLAGSPGAAERFSEAAGAVQRFADALEFNPNEALAVRALLLRLPQSAPV